MPESLEFLETRERFLPISLVSLREAMLRDPRLSAGERGQLDHLFEMIAARFHFEFREKLEHLKAVYEPFDPDRDTLPSNRASADSEHDRQELASALERLLLDANYTEMSREQVIACAEYQSQVGLVVEANLSDYAELRVFYRGIQRAERAYRPCMAPWLRKTEMGHLFSRVVLLVRLAKKPNGRTFVKLFKNVMAEDLEMLLPYVRIRMRLLDHLKIGSSVAGGVATAAWKAFTAAILSPWVFLLILCGFVGACIRGIFSFLSSKTRYLQTLSANLYFQNLANNSSALAHLVDIAEAEECKELLLAYYLLYVERDRDFTQQSLDRRVEEWLKDEFGLDVDFEVSDAVRKLFEKELLVRHAPSTAGAPESEGILKVYDLPSTLRRLDAVWDAYFSYNGELAADQDRLAQVERQPPFRGPTKRSQAAEVAGRK